MNIIKQGETSKIKYKPVWSPVNELANMIYGHFSDRGDGVPRKEIIEKIKSIHGFEYPKAQIY